MQSTAQPHIQHAQLKDKLEVQTQGTKENLCSKHLRQNIKIEYKFMVDVISYYYVFRPTCIHHKINLIIIQASP